jgi:integrase/recombinase XerD
MGDLSRIRVIGPLEPYVSGFIAVLVERGYTPVSAAHQLRLIAHVSRWLAGQGLGPDDLSSERVDEFFAARRAAGYRNYVTPSALVVLLEHLRALGVAPPAGEPVLSEVEKLLCRYRAWLCSERGLAAVTARNYAGMVRSFLSERVDATGELDLRELSAKHVLGFVLAECPHRRPGSAKLLVTALRSLLGYLHVEGLIARPLAPVVPSVAGWAAGWSAARVGGRAGASAAFKLRSAEAVRSARLCDPEAAGQARDAPRRGRGSGAR